MSRALSVVLPAVERRHDVRVVKPRHRPHLSREPVDRIDGDASLFRPVQHSVIGLCRSFHDPVKRTLTPGTTEGPYQRSAQKSCVLIGSSKTQ